MQKIHAAMERFNAALDKLEKLDTQADLDALSLQCAHLRGEISSLKKQKAALEANQRRAMVQVDKAMRQIDTVLGEA